MTSLERFASNAVRCLRFGSPMNRMLEALASEARGCYRAKMEESGQGPREDARAHRGAHITSHVDCRNGPGVLGFVQ